MPTSSQGTKTIRIDAVSNQLNESGKEGECVGVESKSFDVFEREGTVLCTRQNVSSLKGRW